MADRIEPALTEDQWATELRAMQIGAHDCVEYDNAIWSARMIALNNFALPDSDPRKITREMVEALREVEPYISQEFGDANQEQITALLAALESYLPPQ